MVHACGLSDPGPVRKTNEDCFFCDEALQLFVVADGMGGHSAGEVASRLAVEAIEGFIRRTQAESEFSWPYGIDPKLSYDGNRLRTAICLANRRVFRAAESHDNYTGMGTTVVGALFSGRQLLVGHVGDSRLYTLGDGVLTQVTRDDSWMATVLAQEVGATPEALAGHPMRNVLTNVLGAREQIDINLSERPVKEGDLILLCTDGLHNVVDNETLCRLLGEGSDLSAIARRLIQTAIERRGRDNITALLVRYDGHS